MNATPYIVCFYRGTDLVHEVTRSTRDAAELVAMEGLRERLEVSIYRGDKVLKGWNRRAAS